MSVLIIPVIVLGIIVLISYYTYTVAFYSPKSKRSSIDDPIQGPQYEAVAEHIHRISHIMQKM